ncbi:MAG: hypothetical protein AVDCRST_MAG91-1207, partial [uncultured Sphingomonadaceae bacterium]
DPSFPRLAPCDASSGSARANGNRLKAQLCHLPRGGFRQFGRRGMRL